MWGPVCVCVCDMQWGGGKNNIKEGSPHVCDMQCSMYSSGIYSSPGLRQSLHAGRPTAIHLLASWLARQLRQSLHANGGPPLWLCLPMLTRASIVERPQAQCCTAQPTAPSYRCEKERDIYDV